MFNLQNFDWKKIALIFAFILLCILIGLGIYQLFFKSIVIDEEVGEKTEIDIKQLEGANQGEQPGIFTPGESEVPQAEVAEESDFNAVIKITPEIDYETTADSYAKGGITAITNLSLQTVDSLALTPDGNDTIVYNKNTGLFQKITFYGDHELYSNRTYKNVENITWAPNSEKAILEFPDGSNILYNFENDKQISLPKDWTDFGFNNTGSQIVFKDDNPNPEYKFLGTANADGSNQKYIEYMGDEANNFITEWSPNNKIIASYKTAKSASTSELFFLGQYEENFKSINLNGYDPQIEWSPDGNKLVYSVQNQFSDHKPLLYVVDASGNNIGQNNYSLKLNTWADKCTFSSNTEMYCAVPKELPYGAGLVPALADDIPDYIYKINLQTGVKSFVAEPEVGYSIEQMQVSKDGSKLYYTDKTTQGLHLINLK